MVIIHINSQNATLNCRFGVRKNSSGNSVTPMSSQSSNTESLSRFPLWQVITPVRRKVILAMALAGLAALTSLGALLFWRGACVTFARRLTLFRPGRWAA